MHTDPAVLSLPHPAFRLWFDLRVQWSGGNNGRLMITPSIMVRRGWTSHDTLARARDELLRRGLIKRTRYCGKNVFHRASMYALTDLDIAASDEHGMVGSTASHDYRKWVNDGVLRSPPDGQQRTRQTGSNVPARRVTGGENVTARRVTANQTQVPVGNKFSTVSPKSGAVDRDTGIVNDSYQEAPASARVIKSRKPERADRVAESANQPGSLIFINGTVYDVVATHGPTTIDQTCELMPAVDPRRVVSAIHRLSGDGVLTLQRVGSARLYAARPGARPTDKRGRPPKRVTA